MAAASVAAISRNAQRLDRLITNLLDYSSLQDKRPRVRCSVDLEQLCRNSVDLLAFQATTAGISCTLVPHEAPVRVSGDAEELGRVLDNLVGAVKYTRRGGRVEVGTSYDGPLAVVRVRDTGTRHLPGRPGPPVLGVPPLQQPRCPQPARHRARPGDLPAHR